MKLLGSALGGVLPTGGGGLRGIVDYGRGKIQENETARYRGRMSMIPDFVTIEELTDVARQIARQLTEIDQKQLLHLVKPDPVEKGSCSCLPCGKEPAKEQPSSNKAESEGAVERCQGVV